MVGEDDVRLRTGAMVTSSPAGEARPGDHLLVGKFPPEGAAAFRDVLTSYQEEM
jgi:hypothetical protein